MSKKVLNYAGKRPMLLALTIMATLTLGLLFSGWLTPTTGRAQGGPNPPPNQENTNCPPVWGPWQVDPNNLPTISITSVALGDQCVQIPIGSTSGSVSVSANAPKTKEGGKFQVDTSTCGNPNNPGTLSITLGKTTWTAGGCGATPNHGEGENASFSVNAVGPCTVAFTAHGTTTDPSGTYDSSAASQTFNVKLNNQNPGQPGAPQPANPFGGFPDTTYYSDTGPQLAGWGKTVETVVKGKVINVLGVESYVKDGSLVKTGCGASLIQTYTSGGGGFKISVEYKGVKVEVSVQMPGVTTQVFNQQRQDNIRWYGQIYDQMVSPSSGTLHNGSTEVITLWNGGDSGWSDVTTPIVDQPISIQDASDPYLNSKVALPPIGVPCC